MSQETIAPNLISRSQWQRLLSTFVQAEFEPTYRRHHRRYAIYGEVKITGIIDGKPFKRTLPLLEASAEGLTAKSETELPYGTHIDMVVYVTEHPINMQGKIVHCTQTLGGHKVGIIIEFPT